MPAIRRCLTRSASNSETPQDLARRLWPRTTPNMFGAEAPPTFSNTTVGAALAAIPSINPFPPVPAPSAPLLRGYQTRRLASS